MNDNRVSDLDVQKILDVVIAFKNQTSSNTLLYVVLSKMMEITNSDAGTLYTLREGKLHFSILKNDTFNVLEKGNLPPIDLSPKKIQNISAYCALFKETIVIDDVYASNEFNFEGTKKYDELTGYKTQSMLCVPLVAEPSPHNHWTEEVIGVLQLINRKDNSGGVIPFGDLASSNILIGISKIVASTLVNHVYLTEIKELFKSIVAMMSQAIDERSAYNKLHTQSVARHTTNFAQWLAAKFDDEHPFHFNENRIDKINMAALVHDIGKIITPLEVMNKATRLGNRRQDIIYRFNLKFLQIENSHLRGELTQADCEEELDKYKQALEHITELDQRNTLTEEDLVKIKNYENLEYQDLEGQPKSILDESEIESLKIRQGNLTQAERRIMEDHVVHTAKLLEKIKVWKYFKDVPRWASDHHELLDGSGYPAGLKGGNIDIETRIITISDIFDALTASDRPYKKSMSVEKSLEILYDMAEKGKLDKRLVALFAESKVWEL